MVTISLEEIASMFRTFMLDAWQAGWNSGHFEALGLPDQPRFSAWFEENYGDIIGIGTEAPASEKMSEKEE